MSTPEVRLVAALPEHVEAWSAIRAGATSQRLVSMDEDSPEVLLKRLREASSDVSDPRATSFRWMVEADGRIAGTVSARELSRTQGRVEVGYMLAEEFIGRGIGSRAVAMMLERLFTIPVLQRIWLCTTVENLASQAVARKLGFRLEGVLREHCVVQGRRLDQQIWGLLRTEWEARSSH
ncbi:GNAT family N-acetyltransferase [Hyalangium rubrum]|uniref:GNAT family protein n=1 Tax=Hyalangium rubrum TaxID=3103134 RepID=A0ABU5HE79_9BACT|nr:GNAT family protein [Hyalangium sp. s54d21]MDY7231785.1 GNAT family protein [Hyalangium sp. s54d21]